MGVGVGGPAARGGGGAWAVAVAVVVAAEEGEARTAVGGQASPVGGEHLKSSHVLTPHNHRKPNNSCKKQIQSAND